MPTDTDTYDRCNGRLRSNGESPDEKAEPGEWAGEGYCQRPAGEGTSHNGEGRCKLHGGADGIGRPIETGLYSSRREELREKIGQAKAKDTPGSLWDEVAVLRALLGEFLERMGEVDAEAIDGATKLQKEIRRTIDTIHQQMNREAPSPEEIERLITAFSDILQRYVPDSKQGEALDELRSAIRNGGPDRIEGGRAND